MSANSRSRSSPRRARCSTARCARSRPGPPAAKSGSSPITRRCWPNCGRPSCASTSSDSETLRYAQAHGWLQVFGNHARLLVEEAIAPGGPRLLDVEGAALGRRAAPCRVRRGQRRAGAGAEGSRPDRSLSRHRGGMRGAASGPSAELRSLGAARRDDERGLRQASGLHFAASRHSGEGAWTPSRPARRARRLPPPASPRVCLRRAKARSPLPERGQAERPQFRRR